MSTTTYAEVATRTGTQIPDHLDAQTSVPSATAARQGDVYFMSDEIHATSANLSTISGKPFVQTFSEFAELNKGIDLAAVNKTTGLADGHKVVVGEADRNAHILNGEGMFYAGITVDSLLDYGVLVVPEGKQAVLTHTAEHGSIAIPAGTYRFWGQVEKAEEDRRVSD